MGKLGGHWKFLRYWRPAIMADRPRPVWGQDSNQQMNHRTWLVDERIPTGVRQGSKPQEERRMKTQYRLTLSTWIRLWGT